MTQHSLQVSQDTPYRHHGQVKRGPSLACPFERYSGTPSVAAVQMLPLDAAAFAAVGVVAAESVAVASFVGDGVAAQRLVVQR